MATYLTISFLFELPLLQHSVLVGLSFISTWVIIRLFNLTIDSDTIGDSSNEFSLGSFGPVKYCDAVNKGCAMLSKATCGIETLI
jgi:hypothetical protein